VLDKGDCNSLLEHCPLTRAIKFGFESKSGNDMNANSYGNLSVEGRVCFLPNMLLKKVKIEYGGAAVYWFEIKFDAAVKRIAYDSRRAVSGVRSENTFLDSYFMYEDRRLDNITTLHATFQSETRTDLMIRLEMEEKIASFKKKERMMFELILGEAVAIVKQQSSAWVLSELICVIE